MEEEPILPEMKAFAAMLRFFAGLGILAVCCGCFEPKALDPDPMSSCHLVTRQYSLVFSDEDGEQVINDTIQGCQDPRCVLVTPLVLGVAMPAGSFVVSGSIVVVGNTVHWIEEQGRCDESVTHRAVRHFRSGLKKIGGVVIDTKDAAVQWLRSFMLPRSAAEKRM